MIYIFQCHAKSAGVEVAVIDKHEVGIHLSDPTLVKHARLQRPEYRVKPSRTNVIRSANASNVEKLMCMIDN